jgi:C-terminal processing protease CtpA/Prc
MNYGDYLLGYLLNINYQYAASIEKVKSHGDTSQIMKSINGKFLKIHEPQKQNYQGAIYVLMNGGSFSNSGIFCSRLDAYQRAVFIGEETGGNNTVLTGVFRVGRKTVLPNTKIVCDKADNRIIISDLKNNTGHGVMPDYQVVPNINDMIAKKDVVMEFVLDLITRTLQTKD